MASPYTVIQAKHATLVGTTADVVHLTGAWTGVEIFNRAAAGGADIYYTANPDGQNSNPTTPTAAADDTTVVPPGTSVVETVLAPVPWEVAVVGNANDYSVEGFDA